MTASSDRAVLHTLSRFEDGFRDENDVTVWLLDLQESIGAEIKKELGDGHIFRAVKEPFGIAGAIPYIDSTGSPLGRVNRKAAYIGKSDVFFKRGEVFWYAGFELKFFGGELSEENERGWRQGSSFAQAFCWLNGSRTTRYSIILSDQGFKVLYRQKVRTLRSE